MFFQSSVLSRASERVHRTVLNKVIEKCVDSEGKLTSIEVEQFEQKKCIELGSLARILMFVYREEQANRKTAIRLMFHTATSHLIPNDEVSAI
jgi:hypothetical protein